MDKNYPQLILTELDKHSEIADSLEFAKNLGIEHQELVGYLSSLY